MGCTSSNIEEDIKLEGEVKKEKEKEKIKNKLIEIKQKENKMIEKSSIFKSSKEFNNSLEKIKKSICKIKSDKGKYGTGFFCKIPNRYDLIQVLITNNYTLDENNIAPGKKFYIIYNNNKISKEIIIDNTRKTYTTKKDDITIIELKEEDKFNINIFLDIDNEIYKEKLDESFKEKLIYLINYGDNDKMEYSTCEIKSIYNDNYVLEEACLSSLYSSGCPILNSLNLKVIGIQKMVEKKGKSIGVSIKTSIEKFKEKMNTLNSNRGNPEIYIKQKKNGKKKKKYIPHI